ncbi:MAG: amidohydrolase family protein [Saprospiraceae bacterium]
MKSSKPVIRLVIYILMFSSCTFLFSQNINEIKLKDFNPVSIYNTPVSHITKAKYPIIDFHSHDYPKSKAEVETWIKTMDETGIAKIIILSYSTGSRFDSIVDKYAPYKDRFEVWCGFDYTGYDKPGWQTHAVAELERCFKKGAKGVGELGDKGLGEFYSFPTKGSGLHVDDPAMKPLIEKCGALGMPISIHVSEDAWMYLDADASNDGLMNAGKWKVDMTKPGILGHDALVKTLENAVKQNPGTTFIACHLANTCSDLSQLGRLFDLYPNLYADIAARYGELAPVPRTVKAFMEKYAGKIVYGTDMGMAKEMYLITLRILESADEHFYDREHFNYHWPLHGLDLSDKTLRKIYNRNAKKILAK